MVLIQEHSEEIYWLTRRIAFLKSLDRIIDENEPLRSAEAIAREFRKVENPSDLVDRLREIYGSDL
jgi:hypothetical protein